MATLRQRIDALLDEYEPRVAEAFLAAIDDITSRADLKRVGDALARGDIDGALDALNLEPAAFNRLEALIAQVYAASGEAGADAFPSVLGGSRVMLRFDVRNPRAEAWLRDHSSSRITGPIGSIEAIRDAIRPVLVRRLVEGQNPRSTGLDVVGRINRVTGRREGGLIGLSMPQIDTVERVRAGLLSSDPEAVREAMRHYLTLGRRDKRIAQAIERLLREGKKPNRESIDRLLRNLKSSYLQLRGEMIGRTETMSALSAAQDEAFRQGLAKTNYGPDQVIKTWQSAGDRRVRDAHRALNGDKVMGLDTPFTSPTGAQMQYPHDTSLGAGARDVVGCRCIVTRRIDVFGRGADG